VVNVLKPQNHIMFMRRVAVRMEPVLCRLQQPHGRQVYPQHPWGNSMPGCQERSTMSVRLEASAISLIQWQAVLQLRTERHESLGVVCHLSVLLHA
jgi:hypothetical protein